MYWRICSHPLLHLYPLYWRDNGDEIMPNWAIVVMHSICYMNNNVGVPMIKD